MSFPDSSALLLFAFAFAQTRPPVDYVDPNIGGIGYLLQPAHPNVQLPHGMVRLVPIVTPGVKDRYLADRSTGIAPARR